MKRRKALGIFIGNGFILFSKEQQVRLRELHPGAALGDLGALVGEAVKSPLLQEARGRGGESVGVAGAGGGGKGGVRGAGPGPVRGGEGADGDTPSPLRRCHLASAKMAFVAINNANFQLHRSGSGCGILRSRKLRLM